MNYIRSGLMVGLILTSSVWASGNDVDVVQSNDMNNQTSGDLSNNSRTFGFAHTLGDVDINQCLGSTQWGTVLFSRQKLVLNKWCAAEVYDSKGLHHMAAVMRCDLPEIIKHFPTAEQCVVANKWAPTVVEAPVVTIDDAHYEEEEEYHEMYEQRIAKLEARPPPPARVTREVVQKPFLSAEQRTALAEMKE